MNNKFYKPSVGDKKGSLTLLLSGSRGLDVDFKNIKAWSHEDVQDIEEASLALLGYLYKEAPWPIIDTLYRHLHDYKTKNIMPWWEDDNE